MANSDRPRGAQPHGDIKRMAPYQAGGTVYPGDLVKLDSNGQCVVAAATDACVGVAASYATANGTVMVYDDPQQLFVIQSDGTNPDAQTDLNLNYKLTAGTADTLYRISRHELDQSSGATNSNYPLKLLRIEASVGNALGANAECVVKINNHQLAGGTGTLGV